MADIARQDLQATIQAWDQAAWSLAALAVTAQGDGPPELTAAAREPPDHGPGGAVAARWTAASRA